ncbi:sensor histidine kinase [Paenibacillus polymyxa]|uniref:sensor histidine kinase n=1 Tax=Paenibacillus polymyxa TaxID=1406 RepID=UPI0025B6B37D|nr:sensor histidine kinase [Paenibacillus polymyxa]MDN4083896.1 sensor histidine kinase [Paenibacillus polymyxa]MDN4087504.1 sensor histidine kinase [Paenibacillus polymyxa]MDN4109124.1 sensor histidine kinase [Paenibacillus polymyxa]
MSGRVRSQLKSLLRRHIWQWLTDTADRLGGCSLQVKLIVAYIGVILIPVVLFSLYTFHQLYENTMHDITVQNQYVLDTELAQIHSNMEIMERTAQLAISDRNVLRYLTEEREISSDELVQFNLNVFPNLQHLLYSNPNVENIRLYTSNPQAHEIWPMIFNESRLPKASWLTTAQHQQGKIWWDIYKGPKSLLLGQAGQESEAVRYIALLREIQASGGKHAGLVETNMRLELFSPRVFRTAPRDYAWQMFILNGGKSVSSTDIATASFQPDPIPIPLSHVHHLLQSRIQGQGGAFDFTYGNKPYLGLYRYIEGLDAYLLNVVALDGPLGDLRQKRNAMLLIICILILLMSVISYTLHALILKQLHTLRESMKKVQQEGDFQLTIPVYGRGEVAELALYFRSLLSRINVLIAEAVQKQAAAQEAELQGLKYQIDSHFLYNTLENLKMMAEIERQYPLSDALTSLGSMMRYNLQWSGPCVSLRDEIRHIQHYVAIMNIRHDNQIALDIRLSPTFMELEILKMSLQPVVENAIKHGWSALQSPLRITIEAFSKQDIVELRIQDNGVGMSEERKNAIMAGLEQTDMGSHEPGVNRGIGLYNVHRRLSMQYGLGFGIKLASIPGQSTTVTLILPRRHITRGANHDD